MAGARAKLIIWTGPKHSGKTTAAEALAENARAGGFSVAGLTAPSVHQAGRLIGFDVVDLRTAARAPLARRGAGGPPRVGDYGFLAEGLAAGERALGAAAHSANLVIVDEFGPLELRGEGWRARADSLVARAEGLIVLVVREELVDAVRRLYEDTPSEVLSAASAGAAGAVVDILRARGQRCRKTQTSK